jgi:hypothetical protein
MSIAGVPLWTLVLVACVVAPILVRVWIDAEQRRAKSRTARVLQGIVRPKKVTEAAGADAASESQAPAVERDARHGA